MIGVLLKEDLLPLIDLNQYPVESIDQTDIDLSPKPVP
ncbi:hypothetical protein PCC7418_2852 [Halothece sp. PCC 7418]|nr:hypothetical protein PCC7418_2852 [Halothece sp. PCC 7418]